MNRIAEPTARMEGTGVQPDSASGRRRIRCAVRPLRPIWLLCRRTGSDQHQPQRYVPPQGRESQQRSRMAGGLYRPYRGELPHHETASVRRSILARRRFRQRSQPLRRLSPPQGPRKGAPGSLPRCRRRVEQRQTPAVGRTIRAIRQRIKRDCVKTPFLRNLPLLQLSVAGINLSTSHYDLLLFLTYKNETSPSKCDALTARYTGMQETSALL